MSATTAAFFAAIEHDAKPITASSPLGGVPEEISLRVVKTVWLEIDERGAVVWIPVALDRVLLEFQVHATILMDDVSSSVKPPLALVVSLNDEDHWRLIHILRPAGWSVDCATSCEEAVQSLKAEPACVVIADRNLSDGTWKLLLNRLSRMPYPPKLVVTHRLADERLWAEVLNLGGFDVLSQPFFSSEVLRCVASACRHWDEDHRKGEPAEIAVCATG